MSEEATTQAAPAENAAPEAPAPMGQQSEPQQQTEQSPVLGRVSDQQVTEDTPIPDWLAQMPEDMQQDPSLLKFKDVPDLADSYKSLSKMLGSDKLVVPNENSPQEIWDSAYDALGRPTEPGEYNFENAPTLPEGLSHYDEVDNSFREVAHKFGLNNKQAEALFGWSNEAAAAIIQHETEQVEERKAQALQELAKEWGGDYNFKLNKANNAMQAFGNDELAELAKETGLDHHPAWIKMMSAIGDAMSEDDTRFVENQGDPASQYNLSKEQAETELADLMAPGSPYWDKNNPQSRRVRQRVEALNRVIAGEGLRK